MKNLSRFVLIFAAVLVLSAWASGQTAISPEKKAAIAELIAVTKTEEQMVKSTDVMLGVMNETFPAVVRESLEKSLTGMPVKEKEDLINSLIERSQSMGKKFHERFVQRINYKQLIEDTLYPLYDKFFTEGEIRDLVNFYKTPTGQKVMDKMPEMMGEATRMSMDKLTPQFMKIADEVIKEELAGIQPPASTKKKN